MSDDRDARFIDDFKPARLLARDADDLAVLSALLQDAVALSGELAWLPKQKRFAFVANRYRWEAPEAEERVRVGAHFDQVTRARVLGLDPTLKDRPVTILALSFEARAGGGEEDPGGLLRIACAPDALTGKPIEIALEVEAIEAALSDMTRPWAAKSRPAHQPPDDLDPL
ncbi:MAG: DUF2948 family protein [Pseudomonadota bacterium]